MKIWVKFNAGFQLCPPDFNFAPRSRKAGDAPCNCAYVRKIVIYGVCFFTSVFTFSLIVSKQLVVLLVQHTTMTENKKRDIKKREECLTQNGQTNKGATKGG